jgi:elongation factor P
MVIIYNEEPYSVLECTHVKLARGPAFCKVKLKNLKSAQIIDATLRDSDNIREADIEERKLQYSYQQANKFHFLDLETYEDLICDKSTVEDKAIWFKDNLEITGLFYKNELINFKLPTSVVLKVIDTEPGFKGDSVKSGTKPATLETGVVIQVPLFVNTGDLVKVYTHDKQYISRV